MDVVVRLGFVAVYIVLLLRAILLTLVDLIIHHSSFDGVDLLLALAPSYAIIYDVVIQAEVASCDT